MNSAEREEIKTLIQETLEPIHKDIEYIKKQTTITNSRTNKLEDKVKLTDDRVDRVNYRALRHISECPLGDRMTVVETSILEFVNIRKFVVRALGITASLIAIATGIVMLLKNLPL